MIRRLLIAITIAAALATASVEAQGSLSTQVLALLTRINAWTQTNTFSDLRVANAAIPSITTYRIYADGSGNLYFNGGLIAGAGGGVTPHNLLSTTHADVVADAVNRGDIIYGNSTPAWTRLPIGSAGKFLRTNGTDVSWGTDATALTNIPAANLTGTLAALDGTALTALNATSLTSGTVPLARLSNIANAQIAAGAGIAYSKLTLTGSVVNADIASGAAIAYSKLALTGSIVTGDLVSGTLLFDRWASNGCASGQVPKSNGSVWSCGADANSGGTVTSVGLTMPAVFSVASSPIVASGTIAVSLATQAKNLVWSGPASGANAAPTFRAIVNADLPLTGVAAGTYPKVTVNTAGVVTSSSTTIAAATDVSGVLPFANGGTNLSSAADDTTLVSTGAAWVATALPNCTAGAGILEYSTGANTFSCVTSLTALTLATGSIAVSTPALTLTQTWNAAATFTAFSLNITDTSSNAASLLENLQVAASSKWKVDKSGNGTAAGSLTAPFYNSNASSVLTVSANVIAPTGTIHHVGAGLIKTITVPATCTPTCVIHIIPDAAYTYDATGNVVVPAAGGTATINRLMTFAWDGTKWTPSY